MAGSQDTSSFSRERTSILALPAGSSRRVGSTVATALGLSVALPLAIDTLSVAILTGSPTSVLTSFVLVFCFLPLFGFGVMWLSRSSRYAGDLFSVKAGARKPG